MIQQILLQTQSNPKEMAPQFRQGKRVAGFLYGPPGTGKSRYAELIARAMGYPLPKVSLEGAALDHLLGRSIDSGFPTPGKISKAMAHAKIGDKGAKNMVLFIDEADCVINNQHPNSQDILPSCLSF